MTILPRLLTACFSICIFSTSIVFAQQAMDRIERERMQEILTALKGGIKNNYYDPTFHGIDLDARFEKAKLRLKEVSTTGQAFGVIAQVLIDFNDSHLYFLPPGTTVNVQYGFQLKVIGNDAFVTAVKSKTDAEAKGLKPGDQVIGFEGFRPTRKELWKMVYYYYALSPRSKVRLNVIKPGTEQPVELEIVAKVKTKPRTMNLTNTFDFNDLMREIDDDYARDIHFFATLGDTEVWKMTTFATDPAQINGLVDSRLKNKKNVILDLRGNGGGYVDTLIQLAGNFFPTDMKIADRKGRPEKKKENEPMEFKSRKADHYPGKLLVLIDSQSASASEIFARFVQLEKRGTVLGDVSAGAVMQSVSIPFKMMAGIDKEIYYGASITNADVIMSDGKSIEHVGVIPDEVMLPTAQDLQNNQDPVLARALEITGVKVSPAAAWKLFEKAYKWEN